jgi:hypothetical protein
MPGSKRLAFVHWSFVLISLGLVAADKPKAFVDGEGPGWKTLGKEDFKRVNDEESTWSFVDGEIHCTGKPVGVIRTAEQFGNFEMVLEWKHLEPGGNSGVFVWTVPASLENLPPNKLPRGIEVQILDNDFRTQYESSSGKKGDWFTTHGDVFAVGVKLNPFEPRSPDGSRSFPRKELSKSAGQWNHYYIRAINGEVRLWVNGEEVSGGTGADPSKGFICLESEGKPVRFRNVRIRRLP